LLKNPTEVGLYGVPMKILDILSVIPVYLMNSVLPTLTIRLKTDLAAACRIIQHAFDFLLAMAMPILVGVQVLAYPLIFIISSPEFLSRLDEGFYGSDIALRILVMAMTFAFLSSVFIFTLIAIGYQGKLLFISLTGALFNIISNFFVIPVWGFRGAAFTSVLSELIILICSFLMLNHYLKIQLRLKGPLKIVFSAAFMGVIIWVLREPSYHIMQNFNILVLIPLGGIIYGGMLWITGVINKDILRLLKNPS
ncbi:MAG: hypothetical protein UT55_C0005G0001, partial [Candidatus Peregrinibacteria bacterium GW2011_GWE2_39_6]